jgi:uncharacterized protein (DUF486 family)
MGGDRSTRLRPGRRATVPGRPDTCGHAFANRTPPAHHRTTPTADAAMPFAIDRLVPIFLLLCSNVFMTFAWYGHLKYRTAPLALVVLVSWGIAFFEYLLMVPANRWGSAWYSAPQLKGMQEVITLVVFAVFSATYLGQPLKWNHYAGFALIAVAAWLIFME